MERDVPFSSAMACSNAKSRTWTRTYTDLRGMTRACREHQAGAARTFGHILAAIAIIVVATGASACSAPQNGEEEEVATSSADTAPTPGPSAGDLMAKLGTCKKISSSPYATDSGETPTINICDLPNAVFFTADMDVDCDGKTTAVCNKSADPSYQNSTAGADSHGNPLDASTLPYIVVPGVSSRWSYKASGIQMGSVVAVIYNGQITYGVVGDVGPIAIVGEASYAMAKSLGINPNPANGGTDSGVTYVVFKGAGPAANEDHDAAVAIATARAQTLVDAD